VLAVVKMLTISSKTGNHGTEGDALGAKLEQSSGRVTAFSLLVLTEQPIRTRLFIKKSRTSPRSPVQSRSENARAWSVLPWAADYESSR
jgi:hypothetical protein